jgi:hypothetical protein
VRYVPIHSTGNGPVDGRGDGLDGALAFPGGTAEGARGPGRLRDPGGYRLPSEAGITILAGTYDEQVAITKNLTRRRRHGRDDHPRAGSLFLGRLGSPAILEVYAGVGVRPGSH